MKPTNLDLEIQSLLDGELTSSDDARVRRTLSDLPEAQALFTELQNTRQAVRAGEIVRAVPASREFYWSGIQREIQRAEAAQARPVEGATASWLERWRRLLVPAGTLATGVIALLLTLPATQPGRGSGPEVETFASAAGFTYRDYASRTTLVWLSYPAEETFD